MKKFLLADIQNVAAVPPYGNVYLSIAVHKFHSVVNGIFHNRLQYQLYCAAVFGHAERFPKQYDDIVSAAVFCECDGLNQFLPFAEGFCTHAAAGGDNDIQRIIQEMRVNLILQSHQLAPAFGLMLLHNIRPSEAGAGGKRLAGRMEPKRGI